MTIPYINTISHIRCDTLMAVLTTSDNAIQQNIISITDGILLVSLNQYCSDFRHSYCSLLPTLSTANMLSVIMSNVVAQFKNVLYYPD